MVPFWLQSVRFLLLERKGGGCPFGLFLSRAGGGFGAKAAGAFPVSAVLASQAKWQPEPEPNGHCSFVLLTHHMLLFGKPIASLDLHVSARQVRDPFCPGRGWCLSQAKDCIG